MNADPRRPDKVQRYVPAKNNANGEDLTPDYMNIMGQPATTANAIGEAAERAPELNHESNHLNRPDDVQQVDDLTVTTNATNVIPTSSQYGVAIIPSNISGNDVVSEMPISSSDTTTLDSANKTVDDNKDVHTTPSRNDRFKVVKIASLEPFKRGRWKCMDYVDEAPPPNVVNPNITKQPQSVGSNTTINGGGVYLQTQSLPQQQIQQMLLQGGFTNGTQFFSNVPVMPQGQYFYPQVQGQSMPQPVPTSMPAQFMNNQPYFTTGVMTNQGGFTLPQGYSNIQYVPIPAQNSAFVPTSQSVHLPPNFQQSQSYAGQANLSQTNNNPSMMNGHAYPSDNSMPNQSVKNMISNNQPSSNQQGTSHSNPSSQQLIQNQYQQPQSGNYQHIPQQQLTQQQNTQPVAAALIAPVIGVAQPPPQSFDVYTNTPFTAGANSLPISDNVEEGGQVNETNNVAEAVSESAEDPNRNNPVVNAIDNKIEQAMDLVKSHLMYTVREEVEVLKEKIAELMEKIQQLETENNYLRSQIPKSQPQQPPPTASNNTFSQPMAQPQNIPVVNPSSNVVQAPQNPMVHNAQVPTNQSSQNQPIPSQQPSKDSGPIQ